jgi:hypothetical protein
MPTPHSGPRASPLPRLMMTADAELIELCQGIVDVVAKQQALFSVRRGVEDEKRTQPLMDSLYEDRSEAVDSIRELPDARTAAGRAALARAGMAIAQRSLDGVVLHRTKGAELAWRVVQSVAAEAGITDEWATQA